MWTWTPEVAELVGAIAFAISARVVDAKPWRALNLPTPRPPKYDEAVHAEHVRELLRRHVDMLPLEALVMLQQIAALIEAGERLDVFLARERVGKRRGKVQV